jgi:hypothetical protein
VILKELLFTYADLHGGARRDSRAIDDIVFARGALSKTLMSNSIFQQAVADLYLALIVAEDELDTDAQHEKVKEFRLQRRLLRQVVATLDNRVAELEAREELRRAEAEQASGEGYEN